jgi:hypothetical protein
VSRETLAPPSNFFLLLLAGCSKRERHGKFVLALLIEMLLKLFTYVVTSSRHVQEQCHGNGTNRIPLLRNNNGGYYQPGCGYDFCTKMKVATIFADLWQVGVPAIPQISHVAKVTKVGWKYAVKAVDEITITGNLIDPDI